ncbi:hypothetical protein I600_1799 [Maribacter dokdonensis DSW-8]|nr:hypothetical protein I600_1799 [Maribacter dokdonensis DSW-8]
MDMFSSVFSAIYERGVSWAIREIAPRYSRNNNNAMAFLVFKDFLLIISIA